MSEKTQRPTLLPANSSALERGLDLGFGALLDRIAPPFPELMNPSETPVAFLPYLAADRGVAEWSTAAPEAEKRLTVELAWPTARQAGTRKALENAAKGLQLRPKSAPGTNRRRPARLTAFPCAPSATNPTAKKSTPVSTDAWPMPKANGMCCRSL